MRAALRGVAIVLIAIPISSGQSLDLYDPAAYREIHLSFSQSNWWTLLEQNYQSATEIPADLTVDGITYPTVGVRFRGNTSYRWLPPGSQKKSFNIRTDFYVPGQDLLGYDHLNLNNGYHDPTFLREFLTYMICRRHGPAPGCNFVKLYLNGQYWGVYINVQQPNKDMMKQWFRSNDGNRYRGFPTSGSFQNGRCALTWLGSNVSSYLSAYGVKQGDGTDLMLLCNVLNNTATNQLQATLPLIFSVDQFYRYAACMNIATQTDSYIGSGKDHFLYHDDVYGAFHMFPFDVNEGLAGNTTLSPWYNTTSFIKPAFRKTLQFTDWSARYIAHYRSILEETFTWGELGPIITQLHAMLAPDVIADTKKIYTTQQFLDNLTIPVTIPSGPFGGNTTVPGLQPLIQNRSAWLSGRPDLSAPRATLTQLQHNPVDPTANQSVCITVAATSQAASIDLWHRNAGAFGATPMFDDGQHCDGAAGDGVWGVLLPPSPLGTRVEYYAAATTAGGNLTFLPSTAEHAARWYRIAWPIGTSPVRINEFLAKNNTVNADPAGEYEDWVELFNDSSQPALVGGMYLTDDLLNATKWQLPAGQTIPPFGTLLIWCDEDGLQGPLHASFKLSAGGEEVALFDANGVSQLDAFVFGPQLADVSTGRLFDGGLPSVTFGQPTPDQPNQPAGCGLRSYSALDPTSHELFLSLGGAPTIGTTALVQVHQGPSQAAALVVLSPFAAYAPIPSTGVAALVDSDFSVGLAGSLDPLGNLSLPIPIPNDPALAGARLFLQAAAVDASLLQASNALEVTICP